MSPDAASTYLNSVSNVYVRVYSCLQTLPLWTEHVNGNLKDCTHLCWTPMLYQPLYHTLAEAMLQSPW